MLDYVLRMNLDPLLHASLSLEVYGLGHAGTEGHRLCQGVDLVNMARPSVSP